MLTVGKVGEPGVGCQGNGMGGQAQKASNALLAAAPTCHDIPEQGVGVGVWDVRIRV